MSPTLAPPPPPLRTDTAGAFQPLVSHDGTRAAAPLLLEGEPVWRVRSGYVDLFGVETVAGVAVGRLKHLARIEAGKCFFGFGRASAGHRFAVKAIAAGRTQLDVATREAVSEYAGTADGAAEIAALTDDWVDALYSGIARTVPPQRCAEWGAGEEIAFPAGATARPRAGVLWVTHDEGHSQIFGRSGLAMSEDGAIPLSRHGWIESGAESRITTATTDEAIRDDALWAGLDRLHALVLADLVQSAEWSASVERLRAARRITARQRVLANACLSLTEVLQTDEALASYRRATAAGAHSDAPGSLLLGAVRIVAADCRLNVVAPSENDGAPPARDPLLAIARASGFRTRRVALRDDWWRHDNGTLLGYRTADTQPVALVRREGRRARYELNDPLTGATQEVTAEVAETLLPNAETFYRPFPNRALEVMDVIRFGGLGCGRDLWIVGIMSVCGALLGLLPSVVTGAVFNTIIPSAARSQLLQMTIVLIVSALSIAMLDFTRAIALLRIEGKMGNAIQSAIWDRLLSLPTSFFRRFTSGELANRAMAIDGMRQVITGTTVTALVAGVFSLSNFVLLFHYSTSLAWWATLLIGLSLGVSVLGSALQVSGLKKQYRLQSKLSGTVLQLLSSVGKLRVANAEVQAFAAWATRFAGQRRLQFRSRTISNAVLTFNAAFPVIASAVIYWFAVQLIQDNGTLRTGDFLAFMSAFTSSLINAIVASTALLMCFNVVPLYEQARPILEALPEVTDGKREPGMLSGAIEIAHATFRYLPEGPAVLQDLSISIDPGQFVAFVGPSGSGKSTVLRVLLGFESLESGAVYYDGQDLSRLDIQAVRRQMGVVLQNGRIMSGDIYTNIVGSSQASRDDAWEAARMAGFDDDIRSMPMAMSTVLSEGAGTLSGGQRQRLMIARAIVHRPRILLFDEATSALDNRTQSIVSASLEQLQATRIVVAHRLSTIIRADRIYVIDKGEVVEMGAYDDLMSLDGVFAKLARRQLA